MDASFDLVVRTPAGVIRSLVVQAADASTARSRAMQDGSQVLDCAARAGKQGNAVQPTAKGRHQLDIATFSHELASLLAAGLSVVEALRTLAANEPAGPRRSMLLDVVAAVSEACPCRPRSSATPAASRRCSSRR